MQTLVGWLSGGSIGEMLYKMNTPAALAWAHRPYVDQLLMVRTEDEYVGQSAAPEERTSSTRLAISARISPA